MSRRLRFAFLLMFALLLSPAAPAEVPAITAPVTDLAGVLSSKDTADIEKKLVALREKTGAQMAVLVVGSLYGTPIDDYAQEVFMAWGGGSSARDDGVLLVLAVRDRKNRLHLGYGIEPLISDGLAVTMLDGMRADLRAERYGPAIAGLVDAVSLRLEELAATSSLGRASLAGRRYFRSSKTFTTTFITRLNPFARDMAPFPSRIEVLLTFLVLAWTVGFALAHFGWFGDDEPAKRRLWNHTWLWLSVVWIVLPIVVGWGMSRFGNKLFGVDYVLAWCLMVGTGIGTYFGCKEEKFNFPMLAGFGLVYLAWALFMLLFFRAPVTAPPGGILFLSGFPGAFLVTVFIIKDGGGEGLSDGGFSSSGSSYSSSSSSYSSSSSSGSSWGGGGGSSGGGGASSGW